MPASFLYSLTENLTAHLPHNLCAVLPKIKDFIRSRSVFSAAFTAAATAFIVPPGTLCSINLRLSGYYRIFTEKQGVVLTISVV